MNKELMRAVGFDKQVDRFEGGICVFCDSTKLKSEDFRDDLSRKEYSISGMCQKCQDNFFSPNKRSK